MSGFIGSYSSDTGPAPFPKAPGGIAVAPTVRIMPRSILVCATLAIVVVASGCAEHAADSPPARHRAADPDPSGLDRLTICAGNRNFLGAADGFDFESPAINFRNVYWLALASSLAYSKGPIVEQEIRRWAGDSLIDFEFYGDGRDGNLARIHESQGFWAEFADGALLVFRGTAGFSDLQTDIRTARLSPGLVQRATGLVAVNVHGGFDNGLDRVWDAIAINHLASRPLVTLSAEEQFKEVDRTLGRIAQTLDIQAFAPDKQLAPHIDALRTAGVLDFDESDRFKINQIVNVWADTALEVFDAPPERRAEAKARAERRRRDAFVRIKPMWRFRKSPAIWLSGHSLGAALATLAAYRLLLYGFDVRGLVTFGSPRVGDGAFAAFLEQEATADGVFGNFLRHVNDNDIITTVPLQTFFSDWIPVSAPVFIDQSGGYHLKRPGDTGRRGALEQSVAALARRDLVSFYDLRPEKEKGLWTLDLLRSIDDHLMDGHYIRQIETIIFGGPDPTCEGDAINH